MDMTETTTRIFEKLDKISEDVAVVKSQMGDMKPRLDEHDRRLRSIDTRLWAGVGAVTLLAFAIPIVLNSLNLTA